MKNQLRIVITSISIFLAIISIVTGIFISITSSFSLTDLSFFIAVTLTTLALGIFQVFDKAKEVREMRINEHLRPLKITLKIEGVPLTIEAPDIERAEEILKLVQRLQTTHTSPIIGSSVKVKTKVPGQRSGNSSLEETASSSETKEESSTFRDPVEAEVFQKEETDES